MNSTKCAKLTLLSLLLILLAACGSAPVQEDSGDGTVNPEARAVAVPDEARSAYQDVLRLIDQKNWSGAQAKLETMQQSYPRLSSIQTMLGWVYWQAGKLKQAETELLAVTQKKSLYKADAFNYLAIIYRQQGKFSEAEGIYKQAISVWPRDPVLHKNLGILYELYLGRLVEALASYKQAQALSANDKQLNGWVKDLERRT